MTKGAEYAWLTLDKAGLSATTDHLLTQKIGVITRATSDDARMNNKHQRQTGDVSVRIWSPKHFLQLAALEEPPL